MSPTKVKKIVFIVLFSAWLAGVLSFVLYQQMQLFLQFPINIFYVTLSLALMMTIWTFLARNRISGPTRTFTPIQSARTAALALAGSHSGAILAGASSGLLVSYLITPPTEANQDRIQVLASTALAAIALTVVSVWLERVCLVPDKKDDV